MGMVHQELAFCPDLSVAENLCMGMYPRRLRLVVDRANASTGPRSCSRQIGVVAGCPPADAALSTAQEQLVQIASAVGTEGEVLVFDEPTSSLSEPEAQQLFELIESLRTRGVTMIYVSHRMPEVFRLCDRISVLRDGKYVGTLDRGRGDAGQDRADDDRPDASSSYFPHHVSAGRAGCHAARAKSVVGGQVSERQFRHQSR